MKRLPPQAIEVEKHLIGAQLLGDPDAHAAFERLRSEDFYLEKHAVIWDALQALFSEGQQADLLTLEAALKRAGNLSTAGGIDYLLQISAEVLSGANIEQHAEIVKEKSILRRLIGGSIGILDQAYRDDKSPAEVLGMAEDLLLSLADEKYAQGMVKFGKGLPGTFALLAKVAKGELTGITTGFRDFDALTGGLQPTDLMVLAGRPGMGKTAFALSMAWKMAKAGKKVGFFSLEMGRDQLNQRILCSPNNVSLHRLRTGRLEVEELDLVRQAARELAEIPLWIDDASRKTPLQVLSQLKRMKKKDGLDVAFFDYLQLGKLDKDLENRAEYVGEFARGMKATAKDIEIPFIALAQLNRKVEGRTNPIPVLSDLKESGGIEEAADEVGFIHRPWMYDKSEPDTLAEIH
ncbi:MAG TPA: replicative DNA helicase, partial [Fibrobacteria bacterium]|nr:replicative DNA helicase [Fibrobacteria bacterium]